MSSEALFTVPDDAYLVPPVEAPLTRAERRKRLVAARIASGCHPLGKGIRLHKDAARQRRDDSGLTCGGCKYRVVYSGGTQGTYPKCRFPQNVGGKVVYLRDTGCESSDIRRWWPACTDYVEAEG